MNVLTETFLSLAACFTSISECESLILKGHQVSKRRVELVCAQLVSGVLFPGDDHRKYKIRPNAVPESLKDNIRKHILSFLAKKVTTLALVTKSKRICQ